MYFYYSCAYIHISWYSIRETQRYNRARYWPEHTRVVQFALAESIQYLSYTYICYNDERPGKVSIGRGRRHMPWLNPKQNGRCFADDIFKYISLENKFYVTNFIEMSFFVAKYWLCATRQQVITLTNVDQVSWHHMASQVLIELTQNKLQTTVLSINENVCWYLRDIRTRNQDSNIVCSINIHIFVMASL